jgi:MFS family permease
MLMSQVGYILGQVPSNLLLNYTGRPSLYIAFFTVAWGTVSALTCLCTNFSGIVACRFILGVVEYAELPPGPFEYLLMLSLGPRSSQACFTICQNGTRSPS